MFAYAVKAPTPRQQELLDFLGQRATSVLNDDVDETAIRLHRAMQ